MIDTAIVIPCYNEEGRLKIEDFLEAAKKYFLIFVNDGSTDGTYEYLQKIRHENIALLNLKNNLGKANAVRAGFLSASQDPKLNSISWVGFLDADLATPFREVPHFFSYQKMFYPNAESIWGSRVYKLGSFIERKAKRHYTGRVFATMAHLICGIQTYDSQCGAKFFKKNLISQAFQEPFLSRWLFDIEIYLRLKGHEIIEYPLLEWRDIEGSKVSLLQMLFKTIPELIRIRKKYYR